MNTQFTYSDQHLELCRYPPQSQHPTLQAWGSEDEYVLTHIEQSDIELGATLLLNDEFGALGCALAAQLSEDTVWQSDSYIGHCALKDNLARNNLDAQFNRVDSLHINSGHFDTVLIKLPKNLQLLEHQLNQLKHCVSANTQIMATGKVKAVTRQVLQLFEQLIGPTHTSLAVKKSRLIFCTPDSAKLTAEPMPETAVTWEMDTPINNHALTMHNLANVFSSRSLDIGARFMLQHLQPFHQEAVLDLGCGNGVLGLAVLAQSPEAQVTFVDESFMAVASAQKNVEYNLPDALSRSTFIADNCLDKHRSGELSQRYDRIICNPPFHQQNTLTDHIAWQMFNDAKACLHKGGKLWVVGNRHLGYHDKLKRVFGGVKALASNPKFVILEAVKR